jgi:hypothetical protein
MAVATELASKPHNLEEFAKSYGPTAEVLDQMRLTPCSYIKGRGSYTLQLLLVKEAIPRIPILREVVMWCYAIHAYASSKDPFRKMPENWGQLDIHLVSNDQIDPNKTLLAKPHQSLSRERIERWFI